MSRIESAYHKALREIPDLSARLAELEIARPDLATPIAKLEAAGDAVGWSLAVLDAIAELDTAKSKRLCLDCAEVSDTDATLLALTGGRVCADAFERPWPAGSLGLPRPSAGSWNDEELRN